MGTARHPDPVRVSLRLLTLADRETENALKALGRALLSPVQLPPLIACRFKLGTKTYAGKLTREQSQLVKAALPSPKKVNDVLGKLLGNVLDVAIGECIVGLTDALTPASTSRPKRTAGAPQRGCCTYNGGQTPNLTQTQCNQYSPISWDPGNPYCSYQPKNNRRKGKRPAM
jgi:hypothetical protein